jgi:WD40 repeat protein
VLLFAPDARTLFFNTTIDTSIQAYSLPTGDLLPPAHTHPSTPNVLAASSNGDLLLSASPSPPTILIQDRRLAGLAPTHFKPTDSTTSVTCAAFDTTGLASRSLHINLLLGFRDGTLAMYRVFLPVLTHVQAAPASYSQTFQLHIAKVGAITKLHRALMGGVTATAFVPGYTSRAVSVGSDGRCRLVNFEEGGQKLRT